MAFLNLGDWRSVGGRQLAALRATLTNAQQSKYYYDHLGDFQAVIDRYFGMHGHRPRDLAELYLWQLEPEGTM